MIGRTARWTWIALATWQWIWLYILPPPAGPRSAWLAVIACLPLLLMLPGVWRLRPRALVWAGILSLPYFMVGIVEAWSNPPQRLAALVQTALAGGFALGVSVAARRRRLG